jgi:hypothetical protein
MTHNVSYEGTLEEAGVTVYQQGTHKLTLSDGRFVLLESNDTALNLDEYLNKKVEVRGSVMPTVEEGGTIMRVEQVIVVDEVSSSSAQASSWMMCGGIAAFPCDPGYECVDNPDDSCDPNKGGADCGGMCVPASSSVSSVASSTAASSIASSRSSVASSLRSSVTSVAASSTASSTASASVDVEAKIVAMAKDTYADPARWTQSYCTSHIGFCVPAHKNWYYKSFGAANGSLWHVEFDMSAPENLLEAPIQLNLLSGSSASNGGVSGQVSTKGAKVIGYFDWNNGQHFEISADARLASAVTYMVSHITPFETPSQ